MKIEIGEYEVYSSGTIITNKSEDIVTFYIEDLQFEFSFKDDESNTEQNIVAEYIENKKGIRLIFTNFNNSLGTGNISPIKLGQINDKNLYINYRIYAMVGDKGNGGKTIHYSWLTKNTSDESESE